MIVLEFVSLPSCTSKFSCMTKHTLLFKFILSQSVVFFKGFTCSHELKLEYVDIIGYQLFVVNTVEKWMCFLLAYGRKPRFNVFNLILQEKCEFEVAK